MEHLGEVAAGPGIARRQSDGLTQRRDRVLPASGLRVQPGKIAVRVRVARLELKLVSELRAHGVAIFLDYAPSVGGEARSLILPPEELYKPFAVQPKGKSKKEFLVDDLTKAIVERFKDDSFRRALQERFLGKVPLTTQVRADSSMEVILVPVSLRDLEQSRSASLSEHFGNGLLAAQARQRLDELGQIDTRVEPARELGAVPA